MASLNKLILIGNAGRDPETKTFPSGDKVTNVYIATTETWKDKSSGEKKESTEWHRLVFNGKLAEIAEKYIKKGSSIYIEGSVKTRKWTDKDGAEKQMTEVAVRELKLLSGRPDGQAAPAPAPAAQRASTGGGYGAQDDDIPFAPMHMWA